MSKNASEASRWRIELARGLAPCYAAHPGIRMIVLGGSPGRGTADAYSDLDVVVYWDELDLAWLEKTPLAGLDCIRKGFFKTSEAGTYIESYYFGDLKVDFGHATMALWSEWTSAALEKFDPSPENLGMIGGFLTAVPLHGQTLFEEWKTRLSTYPRELAVNVVRANLGVHVRGCLVHQGWERGDLLFFHDAVCWTLKRLLAILTALNRVYYSSAEPRWVEHHLARMPIQPPDTWARMRAVLEAGGRQAEDLLYELVDEVLALVEQQLPEVQAAGRLRGRLRERLAPVAVKPEVRPKG